MKAINQKSALVVLILAGLSFSGLFGCAKGDKGDPGENGSGRIVSTINCSGVVSGATGAASSINGKTLEYDAVLTLGGDVYATASVIDDSFQISGTAFYAAGQNGSATGTVFVTNDLVGTASGGLWEIGLDRTTLVTKATYTDSSVGYPVSMTFLPSTCKQQNW